MKKLNQIDPDLSEDILDALQRAGIIRLDRCVGLISRPEGGLRVATMEEIELLLKPTHH